MKLSLKETKMLLDAVELRLKDNTWNASDHRTLKKRLERSIKALKAEEEKRAGFQKKLDALEKRR